MIDTLSNLAVNTGAFLFALGVIVFVHELGHHLVAKLFGVRVHVFSLGFGKRIWGFRRGDTDYRVSALPLGGYVRLGGELPEEATGDPSEFLSKPRWQRILVYAAGPAMNLVLSVTLIALLFMQGIRVQGLQNVPPVVGYIEAGSAGELAGLQLDDEIVAVNGEPVEEWKDVDFMLSLAPERAVQLDIRRADQAMKLEVTPKKAPKYEYGDAGIHPKLELRLSVIYEDRPAHLAGFLSGDIVRKVDGKPITTAQEFIDQIEPRAGQTITVEVLRGEELLALEVTPVDIEGKGRIGVGLDIYRQLPFGEAVVESVRWNFEIIEMSATVLGKLFTREVAAKSALSGPVEIAAWAGEAVRQSFKQLIFLMGFLSISIGFLNLLPIPVLDGGHILILLIESVLRRDLSVVVKERLIQVGFMILMSLMVVVIFFDLSKNLPGLLGGS
ncbi:MAG: RIP metalloprotease RseP [Acidobacteriota bacterium]